MQVVSHLDLLRLSGLLISYSTDSEHSEGTSLQPNATGSKLSSQMEEETEPKKQRWLKEETLGEWP